MDNNKKEYEPNKIVTAILVTICASPFIGLIIFLFILASHGRTGW